MRANIQPSVSPRRPRPGTPVSDQARVRRIATLKRTPELVNRFGDTSVGSLREMFGGLRVSQIAQLPKSARAALLSISAGVEGPRNPASLALAAGFGPAGINPAATAAWLEQQLAREVERTLVEHHVKRGGNALANPWVMRSARELLRDAKSAGQKLRKASGSKAMIQALATRQIFQQRLETWKAGSTQPPRFEIPSALVLPSVPAPPVEGFFGRLAVRWNAALDFMAGML